MIVFFTDFGVLGPYLGQMEMAARAIAPQMPVVNLMADAPAFDPQSSAYLLAALVGGVPSGAVVVAVVDPGVGGDRMALALNLDGRWLVGPDNGLFEPLIRRAKMVEAFEITWRPPSLSPSFHGRDLFAPTAARLALGDRTGLASTPVPRRSDWPDDLARVIYHDAYGNAWTGLRASVVSGTAISVGGQRLERARTFSDVPPGAAFWYENSSGLAEVAVNGGRAADHEFCQIGKIVII
jgi:S-adenosylmethionine hydrolase